MNGFADLRDLDVTFRPFDGPAPRGSGKPSPFDASWSSTVETLARELRALAAAASYENRPRSSAPVKAVVEWTRACQRFGNVMNEDAAMLAEITEWENHRARADRIEQAARDLFGLLNPDGTGTIISLYGQKAHALATALGEGQDSGLAERGSSAAVVDGAEHDLGHHETVGERQGRQPRSARPCCNDPSDCGEDCQ